MVQTMKLLIVKPSILPIPIRLGPNISSRVLFLNTLSLHIHLITIGKKIINIRYQLITFLNKSMDNRSYLMVYLPNIFYDLHRNYDREGSVLQTVTMATMSVRRSIIREITTE